MIMRALVFLSLLAVCSLAQPALPAKFELPANPIALSRNVKPGTYFEAVGRKSAIFGAENGPFEAWAFPYKLFHDVRISVLVEGQDSPIDMAAAVDRIITRPESTTLIASDQLFTLRAHYFSPVDSAASVILLDIDCPKPVTLTVSFVPDLKPMWPGGLGGQAAYWRDDLKAFIITESRRKVNAFFGSPAATRGVSTPAHQLASGALRFDIKVDPSTAASRFIPLVIAGGAEERQAVVNSYNAVLASIPELYARNFRHYEFLREKLLSVETPDRELNLAFEWAKVSLDKGIVDNPDLGRGLIAGWNSTGEGARPGFGWFFGGDAAINSYAMTAYGDFDGVKSALRFLAKFQRSDGKIPHEISQSAGIVKWFDDYPYGFIHADTTPFFIAASYNYFLQSGDEDFVREMWPVLRKAYQFCLDNDTDGDGILENSKAGLGASELGTLLEDLHQDIYLAAVNIEASRGMAALAPKFEPRLTSTAQDKFERGRRAIEEKYWSASAGKYAYALTRSGKLNLETTAWIGAPMIFGALSENRVQGALDDLNSGGLSADWGLRMLATSSSAYDPMAYNNGGVWPFLTGFASMGEYRYNQPYSGFRHLKAISRLTFDFALGYRPEILSGDLYRPLTESVPHQLFSVSGTVSAMVRGMLGISIDREAVHVRPQLPASWGYIRVRNLKVGAGSLNLELSRDLSGLTFRAESSGKFSQSRIDVDLPLPYFAEVESTGLKLSSNAASGRTLASFSLLPGQKMERTIGYRNGIDLEVPEQRPQTGDRSSELRILSVQQEGNGRLRVRTEGLAGVTYKLMMFGSRGIKESEGVTIGMGSELITPLSLKFSGEKGWQRKEFVLGFK